MTRFVSVKVKATGAHITIDAINLNESVEYIDDVAVPTLPKPKISPSPKKSSAANRGTKSAGDAGSKKEGSE